MFPWIYGFEWNLGNVIFLGIFFLVLGVVIGTMATALKRAYRDTAQDRLEHIRWHSIFGELPASAKTCRHVFTKEFNQRMCEREFYCYDCPDHRKLIQAHPQQSVAFRDIPDSVYGYNFPLDRYYHRGHTWVKPLDNGNVRIGLDEISQTIVGRDGVPKLPQPGSRLHVNGVAWKIEKGNTSFRILSPIDGIVCDSNAGKGDWTLEVRPSAPLTGSLQLLRGNEVLLWARYEVERMHALAAGLPGILLNDSALPVENLSTALDRMQWDRISSEILMDL